MNTRQLICEPEHRLAIHPSGMPVMLPTGLHRVTLPDGVIVAIHSTKEPQRIFHDRDTQFVVQGVD